VSEFPDINAVLCRKKLTPELTSGSARASHFRKSTMFALWKGMDGITQAPDLRM
jgi:hypothetical protein